jgi:hypothetical protein
MNTVTDDAGAPITVILNWKRSPDPRGLVMSEAANQPIHLVHFPDAAVICQMTVMSNGDTLETATVGLEGASWISESISAPSSRAPSSAIAGESHACGNDDLGRT